MYSKSKLQKGMKKITGLSFLRKVALSIGSTIGFSAILIAQVPTIQWENTIGGSSTDYIGDYSERQAIQTSDGGYLIGGWSTSNISGDKTQNAIGSADYWIVKTDANGLIIWDKTIGGTGADYLTSLLQTSDGGYLVGGYSNSGISGDKTQNSYGGSDYWIVKLNSAGNIVWDLTLGGSGSGDILTSMVQTTDGGYFIGGWSNSNISGVKSENSNGGTNDYWVIKLDASGTILWQNTIGGFGDEFLRTVLQTSDGGYVLSGESNSNIGVDKSENSIGGQDYWIVKLDNVGTIVWQNTIGGFFGDTPFSLRQTSDGGYIIGGYTPSGLGGDKTEPNYGGQDYWIVKLDNLGSIIWQNSIGGASNDFLTSIRQTSDGGYVVGGFSSSSISGDKTDPNLGGEDYWIVKLDVTGNIVWQKTIGGSNSDRLYTTEQVSGGGYILVGWSNSNASSDKSENAANLDYWVVKLSSGCTPTSITPDVASLSDVSGECTVTPATPTATNDCGDVVNGVPNVTFPVTAQGTTTVTWTYDDGQGNVTTQTQNIIVDDITNPTALCQNLTVNLDASGNATILASQIDNGSSDNCGIASIAVSTNTFNCTNLGSNAVTLTVTDVNGNTATCGASVTVVDNMAPGLGEGTLANPFTTTSASYLTQYPTGVYYFNVNNSVFQANVDNTTAGGGWILVLNYVHQGGTNPALNVRTTDLPLQTAASLGSDESGTAAWGHAGNTLLNALNPTELMFYGQTSAHGRVINFTTSFAAGLSYAKTGLGGFDGLQNPLNYTLLPGHTATQVPSAGLNGFFNNEGNFALTNFPFWVSASAHWGIQGMGNRWEVDDYPNDESNSTIHRVWGRNSNPANTLSNLPNITAECSSTPSAPTVEDNCAGTVTGTTATVFPISTQGTTVVTWTYDDGNGNTSTQIQNVIIDDVTPPTISCIANPTVNTDAGLCTYAVTGTEFDPTAVNDNCAGFTYTNNINGTSSLVGEAISDATVITWTVTDIGGNTAQCSFTVTVDDNEDPVITCPAAIAVDTDAGVCEAVVNYTIPTATDNCGSVGPSNIEYFIPFAQITIFTGTEGPNCTAGIDKWSCGADFGFNWTSTGSVVPTSINVEFYQTWNNNVSMSTTLNGISDNPYLWTGAGGCNNNIINLALNPGSVNVGGLNNFVVSSPGCIVVDQNPAWGGAYIKVTEVYGGSAITINQTDLTGLTSGDAFPVGATTLEYTATDASGNTDVCTFTVTVTDNEAPTAICQNVSVTLDATGNGSTTAAAVNIGSSDACGIASLSLDQTAFTCANVGPNTVTLTVTDVNSNTNTCTATVDVVDNVNPTAICQDITVALDAAGNATVLPGAINNGSNDACGIALLQINGGASQAYTCANIGANTATLTVTDNNSNVSTCTSTITIQDVTPPTALCNSFTLALNPAGNAAVTVADINNGSSDACGLAGLSVAPNNFTCANIGVNTVVLTVIDNNGNTNTCNAIITIVDNSNPVAQCVNPATPVNVPLNGSGNATITPATVNLGSYDNCGITSWSVAPNTFTCINSGLNMVTLTVTDGSGNTASCMSQVNIQDLVAPIAVCQPVTLSLDGSGIASLSSPTDLDGGSTDNCFLSPGLFTASQTAFNCSNIGTNNVTLTVFDVYGNSATCSSVVTVQDLIAPVATCAPFTVALDPTGNATITAANVNGGSSDNCAIASLTVTPSSFTCANVGANNVTLTATDASGNSSTCSAVVTVQDNTIPVVTCPSNITQNAIVNNCGRIVNYSVGVTDNCSTSSQVDGTGLTAGSLFPVGVTPQSYVITDAGGNTVNCNFTVTILDVQNPVITGCPTDFTVSTDLNKCDAAVFWTAPTASDNCSGVVLTANILPGSTFFLGNTTVTYTATDASGLTATCSFVVTVQDTQFPSITCPANIAVNNDAGLCSAVVAALGSETTTDNCTVASVSNNAPVSGVYPVGVNTVVWTVTDAAGNVTTCNQLITVTDNQAPVAICQDVTVNLDATGNGSTSAAAVNNGSNDNCGIASLVLSDTDFTCTDVATSPNTVTLTVTDVNGNSSTCTADVTVLDNIAPVALCQPVTVNLDASGNGTTTAAALNNGSSDACGIASLSLSTTTFTCANVGANSVTLTVIDVNGNTSTCSETVTVVDAVAPVALCQDVTVYLDVNGLGSTTASAVDNGSSDACGIASLSLSQTAFTCADVASSPNTVTLTVTDNNGNSSTCTADVTVVDAIAPNALCQNISVNLDGTGNASIIPANINDGSNDACGIASMTLDVTSFNCSSVGSNPVTLTVTDVNGNSSSCSATVLVADVILPTAICQNISVTLDATGNATITPGQIDNGSNDECGVTLTLNQTAFDCSHTIAPVFVLLTATDPSGNAMDCFATVTVTDATNPVVACQNYTAQLDVTGNVSITPSDVTASATDACGIASSTLDFSTFTCANVGANTVTLTVTDNNGNSSSCTSTVTVEDNVAPLALCQDVSVFLDAAGIGSTTAALVNNGSSDACGIASLVLSDVDFTCADVATNPNTVTLTVTDLNGNVSTCVADVTVIDNIDPIAQCQDITVQLDAAGSATILPANIDNGSSDNCSVALSFPVTVINGFTGAFTPANWVFNANGGSGSYSFGGTSSLTLTGTDSGFGASTTLCTSIPEDGTISFGWNYSTADGPNWDPFGYVLNSSFTTLTNPSGGQFQNGTANIVVAQGDQFCFSQNSVDGILGAGITISNLFVFTTDGSQMSFDCSQVGVNTVTLVAIDPSGNTTTCTSQVTVEDNVAPAIVCQNIVAQLDATGNVSIIPADVTASATDACGIASSTLDVSAFTCANVGSNTVTLTVTDVNSNISTCTATVTVEDNVAPLALCQNVNVTLDVNGLGSTTAALVNNGSSDACGIASLVLSDADFTCADVATSPNTITLTVTDVNGNVSTCSAGVTVIDNIAPNAICQDISVTLDGTGNVTILDTDIDGGSTDACGIATYVASQTAFDCSQVGANNVTLTLTDVNGNVSSCSAIVTVVDPLAPVITCPADFTVSNDPGLCTASSVAYGNATATDNCTGVVISNNAPTVFPFGATNITWTATDGYGNTATCIQIVTVEDVENPLISCPANLTVSTDAGSCNATSVALGTPVTSDNCTIASVTNDAPATYALGTAMVTWTVTDLEGNSATCNQFVTVVDTEAPAISCPSNVTVPALFGSCEALGVVLGTPVTSDNCTVATVSNNGLVAYPLGTTTVTWTVTDLAGNSTACTQTVTVIDTQLPTIACPVNVTVPADLGLCTASGVALGTPATADNCTVASVTNNAPATFALGTTNVTWTVVDGSTNTSTCVQAVTVLDTQLPTIACPVAVTSTTDAGLCTSSTVLLGSATTNDNCSIGSVTNNAPAVFPLGATTVTWTVVDGSGNAATCTQTVTVTDNELPTIACPVNVTVSADLGLCTASGVALGTPVTADNCSVASVTNNAPATYPLGSTTVVWTIVDGSSNTATCSQTVTVVDTQLPIIACPTNVSVPADFGTCTAIGVALGTPTTADNCSVLPATNNGMAVYPLGNTTVTWTVLDGSGNAATCNQIVTVIDTQVPTITCPVAVTVPSDAGVCTASGVILGLPIDNDNCSVASVTNNAPATYPLGNTNVTWTVTDGSGNTASCTQIVTVIDTQAPIVTCPSAVTVPADAGLCTASGVVLGNPSVTENCSVASITNNAPAVYPLGVTTVIWTVVDGSGNTTFCTQFVTVVDTQLPTIACPSTVTVPADAGLCVASGVALGTPTTGDNCSVATVTNNGPASYPLGNTTVTWTVADGSGNTATCTQVVTVIDTQLPTIACPVNVSVAANAGSCVATGVVLGSPVTADNCSVASVTNNGLSTYPLGTTNVTWTVVDGSGNSQTCVQTVTVVDTQVPTIACPANVTVSTAGGSCTATTVALGTPVTADNCSVASITNNAPVVFALGVTPVIWTVEDGSGNVATCTQNVTVVDNQNPIIACPFPVTATTNTGCTATGVSLGTPTTADNCSVATVTNNAPAAFALGTTTVIWTVTDGSGNTATCTQTVTVTDNILPTITCPADVTVSAAAGTCTATGVALGTPVTADNCSVASVTNNAPSVYGLGTTTVTWTVVDGSGNVATCTQTVTVTDTQLPTIACPTNVTVAADLGSCVAVGTALGTPSTADNCSVASVTNNAPASYPLGNTTVVWTVADGSGNTATCTQVVTVIDTQAPTILCAAPMTVDTDPGVCSTTMTLLTPSTADNCSVATVTSNAPASFPLGTTVVTWTVVDGSGNTNTCTQSVTVEDNELPTIACQSDITLNNLPGFCGRSVNYAVPAFADNCGVASFTQTDGSGYVAGDLFPIGTTYQEFTVVDNSGNSFTCGFNITIVDNELPVLANCPADMVAFINEAGQCEKVVTWQNPTASDNCPGVDLTQDYFSGSSFPIGTTVVTYNVSDNSGNTATCSFSVTVVDQADPIVTVVGETKLTVNVTGATYQWVDCDNNFAPIAGATASTFSPTSNGNYAVIVNTGGCADTSNCETISVIGIEEVVSFGEIVLYPNPSYNGSFMISYEGVIEAIMVYDMTGREVSVEVDLNAKSVNGSELASGKYMVRILTQNQMITKELIVVKGE